MGNIDEVRRSRRRVLVGAPLAAGAVVAANVALASPASAFMTVRNGVGATAVFGLVDVTDPAYGAVGNGVANDSPAIQAAINAAPSGGVVFLPNGNYRLNTPLTVNKSNVTVRGASEHTRLTVYFAGDAITVTGSQVVIENLTIDGSQTSRTATAFAIRHTYTASPLVVYNHLTVRNVNIGAMGSGIDLSGILDQIENVEIRDCAQTTGVAVHIRGGNDQVITRLVVANAAAHQPLAGVRLSATGAVLLSDSDIMAAGSAMLIDAAQGMVFSVYARNTFFDSSNYGLNVTGSQTVSRITFDGCWFSSSTANGVLLNNAALDGISFNGCDILQNNGDGIRALFGTNLLVNASRIGGNNGAGITTAASMPSFTVTASQIGRVTDIGAAFGYPQTYGIFINGGTYTRYLVSGNSVFGNTLGAIIDGGTTANKYVGSNVLA